MKVRLPSSHLDDRVEAQLPPGKHHDDNDQRSPSHVVQILLVAGEGPEVGEQAQAERGDADQQSRPEEQRSPREFEERRGGEERDEQPEGGDSEGGQVLVHRGPGLLEDGDDVEGHHGEARAAVENVERLGDDERFEESSAGENPQFARYFLPECLQSELPVLSELLQLLLSLTVAPQSLQGPLRLLQSVLLSQPVGSLRDLAQSSQGQQDGGDEEPDQGPPLDQQGQAEGEAETQTETDVGRVTKTSSQLLAGRLGYVDQHIGVHQSISQTLHLTVSSS